MRNFAVSVVGQDRPGIAAGVAEVLLAHQGNIEDSQMTILRGHFTIMLIARGLGDHDRRPDRAIPATCDPRQGLERMAHRSETCAPPPEFQARSSIPINTQRSPSASSTAATWA